MRNDRSGLRMVLWGLLIIVVVAIAAGVIGYQFKLIGDQRTYIDANSGDLARDRTILGYRVSRQIIPTAFSDEVRKMGLAGSGPDWQEILQFSWISGTDTHFPMNGADTACAGAMWKIRNEPTEADRKKLLGQYVKLLEAHDPKGMVALSQAVGVIQEKRLADHQKNGGDS